MISDDEVVASNVPRGTYLSSGAATISGTLVEETFTATAVVGITQAPAASYDGGAVSNASESNLVVGEYFNCQIK